VRRLRGKDRIMRPIDHLFAALDALRHLSPAHPLRMAALDAIWFAIYPDWVDGVYDCEVPF
jgi:hypothetical protein